jgi:hypothetical protein
VRLRRKGRFCARLKCARCLLYLITQPLKLVRLSRIVAYCERSQQFEARAFDRNVGR